MIGNNVARRISSAARYSSCFPTSTTKTTGSRQVAIVGRRLVVSKTQPVFHQQAQRQWFRRHYNNHSYFKNEFRTSTSYPASAKVIMAMTAAGIGIVLVRLPLGKDRHHATLCQEATTTKTAATTTTTTTTTTATTTAATSSIVLATSTNEEEEYSLFQKCIAETIGTGMIVGGGCGAVCASKFGGGSPLSLFSIATAFGISVALAVYTTRDISGAHLNPAITASLAFHAPDSCPLSVAGPYMLAQTAGATVAAALNYGAYQHGIAAVHATEKVAVGTAASSGIFNGAFHMIPNASLVPRTPAALAVEVALTTCLAFLVFALTDNEKTVPDGAAPALVGTTVAALVMPGAPLTGCGMNPARDLGPRMVASTAGRLGSAAWSGGWWIYTVGPVLGGITGGALYKATLSNKKKD